MTDPQEHQPTEQPATNADVAAVLSMLTDEQKAQLVAELLSGVTGLPAAEAARAFAAPAAPAVPEPAEPAAFRAAPAGFAPAALSGTPAPEANVTDEIASGGTALGSFVQSVGLAVAKAQEELDKTLVTTAKALSDQKIKVVSVFEQLLKDDGTMEEGKIHEAELPLVNYLMPTAYAWSRVHLDADMEVSEFNSKHGIDIKNSATSAGFQARAKFGIGGFGGSASGSFNHSRSSTNVALEDSLDKSAGKLHLEATLEPRDDVELPRPFIVQKGPSLAVLTGPVTEKKDDKGNVTERSITLTVQCKTRDNQVNPDRQLGIKIEPATVSSSTGPTGYKTDGSGQVVLTLTRSAANQAQAVDATVSVNLGMVNETTVVRF